MGKFSTGDKEGHSEGSPNGNEPKKKGSTETTHIRVENNQVKKASSSAPGPHKGVDYVY